MVFLTLLFNVLYNGCGVGANIWLAKWSTDEDEEVGNMSLTTLVKLLCFLELVLLEKMCSVAKWNIC